MDNILILLSVFCSFAPLISIFSLTPYICKKDSAFGVMLSEDMKNTREIRKFNRNYTVFALVAGVMLGVESAASASMLILGISLCAYVLLCLGFYVLNNRLVRNIIITKDFENLQKNVYLKQMPQSYKAKLISVWWFLSLIIPLGVSIWFAYKNTVAYAIVIPVIQGVIFISVMAIYIVMKRSKHYVNKNDVENSINQNIAFRRKWSLFSVVSGLLISCVLTLMQLEFLGITKGTAIITAAPFVITILVTALAIIFALKN